MKKIAIWAAIAMVACFSSCEKSVFGVDESVWVTLNEKEREQVIDGYNKHEELKIENRQKERELELENERQRQELEAQNAPFKAVASVVSSIAGNVSGHGSPYIQSIKREHFKTILQIGDTSFEISPFSANIDHWISHQPVKIGKTSDPFHSISIKNLDNGETVQARRK
jgi:hypothetical protein